MDKGPHDHPALARLRDITGGITRTGALRRAARGSHYDDLLRDDGHLDHAEQLRIFEALLPPQNRASVWRFFVMLTLSVTIAVMGLAANSAAVVIGAMLIAPLMTPIMTFSAAVGLGLGARAVQAFFLVVAGTLWCVVSSAVITALLPSVELGSEVLARTSPDVRDLVVAIAAGAAGAYATAREDVSSALPGVAVAVALVPPLAATGLLIASGERVLAEGSTLLYLTNLLAIMVSALIVFVATDVIPTARFLLRSPRVAATTAVLVVATVAVAIPLTQRSLAAADSTETVAEARVKVEQWIGDLDLEASSINVSGSTVSVELTGPDEPPPAYQLATSLTPVLGDSAEAIVRWDQRALGRGRADTPPVAAPEEVATEVIDEWVASLAAQGVALDVLETSYGNGRFDVVVSGPAAPPPAPQLPDEIATAIGEDVELSMRWIPSFDPGLTGEPPAVRLERVVRAWIGPRSSVRYVASSIDSASVIVDLAADGRPLGLDSLRRVVIASLEGVDRVEVRTFPLNSETISPDAPVPPLLP